MVVTVRLELPSVIDLAVVGGTYFEKVTDPSWHELYGSGLRAAAAISNQCDVTFYTYVGQDELDSLKLTASTFKFKLTPVTVANTKVFFYPHPLAVPHITHHTSLRPVPIKVFGNVLCFGMLEGNPVVKGDYVVYDPQSATDPRPFKENGSSAKHLAIALNIREGSFLTAKEKPDDIATSLLNSTDEPEVVIVKMGIWGALVATKTTREIVPAYPSRKIWPIGTGDIFSATFCSKWLEDPKSPAKAADLASRTVAKYCEAPVLPIVLDNEDVQAIAPRLARSSKPYNV